MKIKHWIQSWKSVLGIISSVFIYPVLTKKEIKMVAGKIHVILCCPLLGKVAAETKKMIDKTFGDSSIGNCVAWMVCEVQESWI